jgi:hypothetical protein
MDSITDSARRGVFQKETLNHAAKEKTGAYRTRHDNLDKIQGLELVRCEFRLYTLFKKLSLTFGGY